MTLKNTNSGNTTVAISPVVNVKLTSFCKRYELQKKDFINLAIDYFEKYGIDPSKHSEPKSELEKIIKRIDQVFGFMKIQEKEYLRPSVQSIIATEIRLKEQLGSLTTVKHLGQLPSKDFMNNLNNDIKMNVIKVLEAQQKQLHDINKNVVESHKRLINELDEIKRKKGFSF